jgi:hypothetical protein
MVPLADFSGLNLLPWQNFYEVIGSSAGALIGLQFVVIALIASSSVRANKETINAFGTPTVVHFGGALTISAIMVAPWPSEFALCLALVLCGIGGIAYSMIVFRRARRQTGYKPDIEDWVWYVISPCGIYVVLAVASFVLWSNAVLSLFVIAGGTLSLLLIGIHNAWDTVTHIVSMAARNDPAKPE